MEQEVLTAAQKKALTAIGEEKELGAFYLTGGTALAAYYFQHRVSDDLDFFTPDDLKTDFLHEFAERFKTRLGARAMNFMRLYDRYQFTFALENEELKIEFVKYAFKQLEEPAARDGIRIDSLRDIAANKLMTLVERFDPKDFVDMYYLLQKYNLDSIRGDVEKKFGMTMDTIFLAGEFAKARRITALPHMIKPLAVEALKEFFGEQTLQLKPRIIEE